MEFKTIDGIFKTEFSEKRSKFIAFSKGVSSKDEAMEFVLGQKSKFFDATHNCFAYLLLDGESRFSDDGEPNLTAGKPILDAIGHSGFKNAVVCVTRYFGGVKLGTGGLMRAYQKAACDVLSISNRAEFFEVCESDLNCDYAFLKTANQILKLSGAEVLAATYTDIIHISFDIRLEDFDGLKQKMFDASKGQISLCVNNISYKRQV